MKTDFARTEYHAEAYQFDEFSCDWPVTPKFQEVVADIKDGTLATLATGKTLEELDYLKIGVDSENYAVIPPRVLRDHEEEFAWFHQNGYFELDKEAWTVKLNEKWKALFIKLD